MKNNSTSTKMKCFFSAGFYFSTDITILTDIVGVENVAHGYSLLNLFLSINFFTAAPLAGKTDVQM